MRVCPSFALTYDGNGNLLSETDAEGTTNYVLDQENQLTSVTLPGSGGTVSFQYDPFGRRIYKSSPSGTTIYVYDGVKVLQEVSDNGMVVASYTQALGIDEPLAMQRGGTMSYYLADGLGSITSLTDSNGDIVSTYQYDSFGNLTASTGSIVNPFRFTGREFDAETGLYYYRARYYDPAIGRFIQSDPIGLAGGINTYAYVLNNPLRYRDPTGQIAIVDDVVIIAGTAAIAAGAACYASNCGQMFFDAINSAIEKVVQMCTDSEREKACEESLERDMATCNAIANAERAGIRPSRCCS